VGVQPGILHRESIPESLRGRNNGDRNFIMT
jgi:hypothetical protein